MDIDDISEKEAKNILNRLAKSRGFDYFSKSSSAIKDFYHSSNDGAYLVLSDKTLQFRRAGLFVMGFNGAFALKFFSVSKKTSFRKILKKLVDLSENGNAIVFRNLLIADKHLQDGVFLPTYSSFESILVFLDISGEA